MPTPQLEPPPAPQPIEEVDIQPPDDLQFIPDDLILPDEPIDQPLPPPPPVPTRRSTRERRPPVWHRDYVPTDAVAMPTLFEPALEAAQDLLNNPLFALKAVRVPWSSGPGPRLCVSGCGFDSHPGDQYVRTGNSQSLWDRVVG